MNILLEENKIALEKNSALEVEKLKKEADFERFLILSFYTFFEIFI